MKIPETSANVGAYYGNEENGQWQPNGVMYDSGVGGGVVGSGDAGIHRPPVYPVHIPRGHMPGYVMAGAYYPPAAYGTVPAAPPADDFADYMWMENEEEFDKQVMQQLEEEALMEQCIEAMLEDEQRERHNRPHANGHHAPTTSNGTCRLSLEETVSRSTLNPLAAEFVPTFRPTVPNTTEEATSQESTEASPTEDTQSTEVTEQSTLAENKSEDEQTTKTEEPVPQKDPPEVSANTEDKKPKDRNQNQKPKPETKKPVKTEVKPKAKPTTVKSETKVTPKKKEIKTVKSDTKLDEKIEEVADVKPQPAPVEETQASSGFKPINYAAAAKANKPKKPSPPPTATIDKPIDKQTPPKIDKPKTIEKTDKIPKPKTEKVNVQRKNSTK